MFEARTYEALMEEVLAAAPPGIDTRKGSIFFDSTSAIVNLIAKYYTDRSMPSGAPASDAPSSIGESGNTMAITI